jgi:hypothetical protein
MKEQDLFYLLALQRIEAWAIWPNSRIVVQAAVLQRLQLAAIDGIGSVLLKNLEINPFSKKQLKNWNL